MKRIGSAKIMHPYQARCRFLACLDRLRLCEGNRRYRTLPLKPRQGGNAFHFRAPPSKHFQRSPPGHATALQGKPRLPASLSLTPTFSPLRTDPGGRCPPCDPVDVDNLE